MWIHGAEATLLAMIMLVLSIPILATDKQLFQGHRESWCCGKYWGMKEIGKYGGWEGRGVCVCACVYITFIEEPEKKPQA